MSKFDYKVDKEVATTEIKNFAEHYLGEEQTEDQVKEAYPALIRALQLGYLVIGADMVPVYTLEEPIKYESGEPAVTELKFKTRITLTEKKNLGKGLDAKRDAFEWFMKVLSFMIGHPTAMLDKLGRFDYKVVEAMGSLFL